MRIPMWILAALCVVTGLFPNAVQKYLLTPAVNAAVDTANYIDQMMGSGTAAAAGITAAEQVSVSAAGCWQPISWLLLLLSVTCAVGLAAVLGSPDKKGKVERAPVQTTISEAELDPKYESFFSGELSVYSQVGGSDLFWGFKENWKKYFAFWHNWHSGIVNDYELYGVVFLAVVLVYSMMFI